MSGVRLFDISHYNASADFKAAKAAGYEGVYLKATEGATYVDPTFAARKAEARAAGLKVGAYLFFRPAQDVAAQVSLFRTTAGHCDLRVALDHETTDGLDGATCAAAARSALALLTKSYAYAPLLYTYPAFAGNCAGLGGFPLWIADYSGAAAPRVPSEWVGNDWAMWQTGQTNVSGVSGGDGPGTDVSVAPSFARLIVPTITPTKGKPVSTSNLTEQDWADIGALVNKTITHVRNGSDYNLGRMAAAIAQINTKLDALAAKSDKPAGFGN